MIKSANEYAVDLTGVAWRTSSYTAGDGRCVEVAPIPATTAIVFRDTKDRTLPAADTSGAAWSAFVPALPAGTLPPA
ncbi:DUF397 domain-containing protein [Streptomyces sp. NPDC093109]|uniref:DUF397 domain-containing protein n=1 Tax=Streptomyces sp. NPDC093109 TaxID=3154977 RepID=UPI00344FE3AE